MNKRIILINALLANLAFSFAYPLDQNSMQDTLLKAIKNDSTNEMLQSFESVITQGKENSSPMSILLKAIMNGTSEEIKTAFEPIINQGIDKKTPLVWAVLLKKSNAVKALIEYGAEIDPSIVEYAMNMHDFSSMLEIVKSNIDISKHMQNYMIRTLIATGHGSKDEAIAFELIQELINHGFNLNDIWNNPFNNYLFSNGLEKTLKFFLEQGANSNQIIPNETNYSTPLLQAIKKANMQAIEMLLNAGADINQKANSIKTPLSLAVSMGNAELVKLLLERGADL